MSESDSFPEIEAFAAAAERYCSWIEAPTADGAGALGELQQLLADVHAAVVRLPDYGYDENGEPSEGISKEEWEAVRERFAGLPVNGYWEMLDPLDPTQTDPVFAVLEDDLADVYAGLKVGLRLLGSGTLPDAVWEIRWSYRTQWGRHLLGAQRVVYEYFRTPAAA